MQVKSKSQVKSSEIYSKILVELNSWVTPYCQK